jgi:DnaK suppressor protein
VIPFRQGAGMPIARGAPCAFVRGELKKLLDNTGIFIHSLLQFCLRPYKFTPFYAIRRETERECGADDELGIEAGTHRVDRGKLIFRLNGAYEIMDKNFTKRMRDKLASLKTEILQNLASENEEFMELIHDKEPKDLADIASDDIDKKMLKTLEAQELKRLQLIDTALSRIENGHYGKCMKCGKKIPEERLEAIPYAFLCIQCKSQDERRNR